MNPSDLKAFERVKDQIGTCGIWCGSCLVGNGLLKELTKRYEDIVKGYDLKDWAPKDFDFKEFLKGLTSIQTLPGCPGCSKGGGRPDCEIRLCAAGKNIAECLDCKRTEDCRNRELLQRMRSGALKVGMKVKIEKNDRDELITNWVEESKNKFPAFLLFLNG